MLKKRCPTCGKDFEAQRKSAKFCSDQCRYHNHLVGKKRITIPRDLRFTVLLRDRFLCRYCGATPSERELRVDHMISLVDGGALTDPNNLVTTCDPCNAGKGSRSVNPKIVPPLKGKRTGRARA